MTGFSIIPAIDILNGQLVRLTQGQYDQVESYAKTPQDMAKDFESFGVPRIHIVDLDGAKDGKLVNSSILSDIRSIYSGKIEFGGGIRSVDTARYALDLGIDYIILGSLLIKNKPLALEIISTFPNKIIAGIDAKNGQVATEGWLESSELPATELASYISEYPIESIIYTDIAKDGMMAGPNLLELTQMAKASSKPIIASGGVRHHDDILELRDQDNIMGCIVGKAILGGHVSLESLWVN